ncbi:MAG: hypothetical protein ACK4IK_07760 [Bacteroidia bacterium]
MRKSIYFISSVILMACNNAEIKEEFKTDLEEKSVYTEVSINRDNEELAIEEQADPAILDWIFDELINDKNAEIIDTEGNKLNEEGINKILNNVIKRFEEDPNKPGSFIEITDTVKITKKDVTTLIMKESWEIDKSTMKMRKKVEKIAPVMTIYDDKGNLRGRIMLFWVKLK